MDSLDRDTRIVKYRKLFWAIIFVVAVISAGGIAWHFLQEDAPEKEFRPISVMVEEVRIGSLSRKITAVGTLIANQTVIVRPEISGVIGKIYVKGGELVKIGEPLFELDDRQIQAEVKEAEARLNFAKIEYDRYSTLASKNFGSQQKMDDAKSKFLVAEASVESGRLKLERTMMKAPFTGLVGIHNLSIGAVVSPDKELTTFVDLTPMQVEFRIPAQFLKFINEGQRVDVFIDGYSTDKPSPGIISNIDAKIDPNAHSVIVRALISNKTGQLRPGLFARVDLVVGSKDNTMIVSEAALMNTEGTEQVYKIFEGIAYKVDVRTGIRDGESVEIVQGLAPNDHVVVEGHAKIRDQYPVRYELNGKQYIFDKVAFEKKIKELEARKKAMENGDASSMKPEDAPANETDKSVEKKTDAAKADQAQEQTGKDDASDDKANDGKKTETVPSSKSSEPPVESSKDQGSDQTTPHVAPAA